MERLRTLMAYPIVVDGRNLYDPVAMSAVGLIYSSIGRPAAVAETRSEPGLRVAAAGAPLRTE
jgi:UDPglucose 6-dehydrogenase